MKRILISLVLLGLMLPLAATNKTSQFNLSYWLYKPVTDQAVLTTSSPTFAGLTLSGSTASTLAYLNASKKFTSLANGAGYLLNDGSGGLSWGALDLSPYVKKDGSTELTADWNVGAFDLTCVDMSATNFKLSGTGTLTSTAGNASFTTALTAATGNEIAFALNYTTNKLTSGNDTGLKITQTDTASPGTSYLQEWYVGSTQKGYVDNTGIAQFDTAVSTGYLTITDGAIYSGSWGNVNGIIYAGSAAAENALTLTHAVASVTATTGTSSTFRILPYYNIASGDTKCYDLWINRTETAVTTTGDQRLITGGTGGATYVEKFGVSNKGAFNSTMINNVDSDTDEIDSLVWAGGYGMLVIACSTDTAAGVYRLEGTTLTAISANALFNTAKDNAATYNVYFEAGSLKVQNKVGENKAIKVGFYGL